MVFVLSTMKTNIFLRCFCILLSVVNPLLTGKETKILECCIRCITNPMCHSFKYDAVNVCIIQGDVPTPPLLTATRNFTIEQLQTFENTMFHYMAIEVEIQVVKRPNTYLDCPTNVTHSSLKQPGCPKVKVKAFHAACRNGNLAEVMRFICRRMVNVNCTYQKGKTALMEAFHKRQNDIVAFLLHHESDLSAVDDDNITVLHYACYGGSRNVVKTLLDKYKNYTERKTSTGQTPVVFAVIGGKTSIVRLLKDRGVNMLTTSDTNNTILHGACTRGYVDMVKYFLSLDIFDIDCKGRYGRTPLMSAISQGHVNVAELLKKKGASLTAKDHDNYNILHTACKGGVVDMVKYVLSFIDKESKGKFGRTPLMVAICSGHKKIVNLLKKKGASLKAKDDDNNSILHTACTCGNVDMVKYVLSLNVIDIETKGFNGRTPLMTAIYEGHKKVVDLLHEKGADLKAIDNEKNTILHTASKSGDVDMVTFVLSLNVINIETRGYFGRTPLMTAVCWGHINVINLLKTKGAHLKALDKVDNNILHTACTCKSDDIKMVKYVISLNIIDIESKGQYGRTPLLTTACEGHIKVFNVLKELGANTKAVDEEKDNILHTACLCGELPMVKYIVSSKMIHIDSIGHYGRTPLLKAVCNGHISVVKGLLELGADPSLVDDNENNIPHMACYCGDVNMVKYVFSLKTTDIKSRGKFGRTPLLTAVCRGYIDVVKLLYNRYGARITASDDRGYNAFHLACEKGRLRMVKYLATLKELRGFERKINEHGDTPVRVARKKRHSKIAAYLNNRGWKL